MRERQSGAPIPARTAAGQPRSTAPWAAVLLGGLLCGATAAPGAGGMPARDCITQDNGTDSAITLHDVQTLGTHNSYHRAPAPAELAYIRAQNAERARRIEYSHPPLRRQLEMGVRYYELDVYRDPEGGRFAQPEIAARLGRQVPHAAAMRAPGLKVLHGMDDDYHSTCLTLRACLKTLVEWSRAHPRHVPIFVLIEAKQAYTPVTHTRLETSQGVLPFDPPALLALERELEMIVGRRNILRPIDVRGNARTLREAVTTGGWPALAAARGKFVFLLYEARHNETDRPRSAAALYLAMPSAPTGRLMFTLAQNSERDYAAFVNLTADGPACGQIQAATGAGFIVRRRTDAHTMEARNGQVARRDAAINCGAQLLVTDFLLPAPALGSAYSVSLPHGNRPRCRPKSACFASQLQQSTGCAGNIN